MDLTNALWITLIGMGLVFVAILMLWGLMALLVRVTAQREPAEEAPETALTAVPEAAQETAQLLDRKRKAAAAAAAVAVALASNGHKTSFIGRERQVEAEANGASNALNAWQAVNRASLLSRRSASSRKKVI